MISDITCLVLKSNRNAKKNKRQRHLYSYYPNIKSQYIEIIMEKLISFVWTENSLKRLKWTEND